MNNRKIDIYFKGEYLVSTTWHKTCKSAVISYIGMLENRSVKSDKDIEILENLDKLKAWFSK